MTSGTLWLSVVKGEGTGSIEKERGAADTLERSKDTVHTTDGGIKQQHDKGGRTGKDTVCVCVCVCVCDCGPIYQAGFAFSRRVIERVDNRSL